MKGVIEKALVGFFNNTQLPVKMQVQGSSSNEIPQGPFMVVIATETESDHPKLVTYTVTWEVYYNPQDISGSLWTEHVRCVKASATEAMEFVDRAIIVAGGVGVDRWSLLASDETEQGNSLRVLQVDWSVSVVLSPAG